MLCCASEKYCTQSVWQCPESDSYCRQCIDFTVFHQNKIIVLYLITDLFPVSHGAFKRVCDCVFPVMFKPVPVWIVFRNKRIQCPVWIHVNEFTVSLVVHYPAYIHILTTPAFGWDYRCVVETKPSVLFFKVFTYRFTRIKRHYIILVIQVFFNH